MKFPVLSMRNRVCQLTASVRRQRGRGIETVRSARRYPRRSWLFRPELVLQFSSYPKSSRNWKDSNPTDSSTISSPFGDRTRAAPRSTSTKYHPLHRVTTGSGWDLISSYKLKLTSSWIERIRNYSKLIITGNSCTMNSCFSTELKGLKY